MNRYLAMLLSIFALLWLPACSTTAAPADLGCNQAANTCLQGTARVALNTDKGQVLIELDGKNAPLTAGNFLDLVKRGAYNNTVFHRVVNQPTPFVVQGGDPQSAKPGVSASLFGTGNFLDPASGAPRFIPLEVKLNSEATPRYGRPISGARVTDQLALPHHRGAVAMARSQDPNSASAQFYVALSDLPELDGRYAVFGRVIEGMPVVDRIVQGDRLRKAELLQVGK
ncbi:peptidylprolyl isomerase [Synechococcus lacustris]|uniref:peptidylprolyl isomerase n=2 Tax=Synechococcus TaxID=1129 RepID=UPI0020CB8848|nr:peptidylprolyl isomerase [Synechococcus lacustris]MCP9795417.1 peptidylprolyl isomerase [Synechococcus lacustris L1F-Slac]MCP9813681.1 peptidylprolyl isomerase [Synechococcus lacustris L1E-Slac]